MLLICNECDDAILFEDYREPAPERGGWGAVFTGVASIAAFAVGYTVDLPEGVLGGAAAAASQGVLMFETPSAYVLEGMRKSDEQVGGELLSSLALLEPPAVQRAALVEPLDGAAAPARSVRAATPALVTTPRLVATAAPETRIVEQKAPVSRPVTDPREIPATQFICRLECASSIVPAHSFPLEQTYVRSTPEFAVVLELMVAEEMLRMCVSLDGHADMDSGLRCTPQS